MSVDVRNGATWIRDCLLKDPGLGKAVERLEIDCRDGIRHFSATGKAVPLDEAKTMEIEISRLEDEEDGQIERASSPSRSTVPISPRPGAMASGS